MKEEILSTLKMKDVLYKYGIKVRKDMFSCPFHGADKNPSAKAYDNSFYCFTCHKGGDVISFVEDYFNLSFKEAMQKLNEDFNLGLSSDTKINYEKINQLKQEREQKEKQKIKLYKDFSNLCDSRQMVERQIKNVSGLVTFDNMDNLIETEIQFQNLLYSIDMKLEMIEKKMALL